MEEPERLMSVAVLARRLGKLATAQSQTLSEVYAFARHCCPVATPVRCWMTRLARSDVQDAEHFVGELGPTFTVVRSTSESTPQTERQCAEKLTF
jgi:hypothetical protein